jgi:ATP-dependent Lhr-like helicase
VQHTKSSPSELKDALWDAVARGLVTADGFSALRALHARPLRLRTNAGRGARGLRQGARSQPPRDGRWALLPPPTQAGDREELAEAVAEQLLARYGVVFRDLIQREAVGLPWRDVLWAFRRLEARGQVRGGRFVAGFVGEQYALPQAVELLREIKRTPLSGEIVQLSACDPLNLVGIVLPGQRVPAVRGNTIRYRDGVWLDQASTTRSSASAAMLG